MRRAIMAWIMVATILPGTPVVAQLGGVTGGLGGAVGGLTQGLTGGRGPNGAIGGLQDSLGGVGDLTESLGSGDILSLRRDRLRALVRSNRAVLDVDDKDNPIRRDEIIAINLSGEALVRAQAAGFTLIRSQAVEGLDFSTTLLAPPRGRPARKAIEALRKLDPEGRYTLDHIYEPARAPLAPAMGVVTSSRSTPGTRIGLIDGGVGTHAALAGAAIEQRGFAGEPKASGHGTAVAALIVGQAGAFHGAAPGVPLLVADIYGGSQANGSADAIVRAMGWLAKSGVRVVNISLVGPPNALLESGIKALIARGVIIVAAVGNDGPAAPPQYPASYPGVVAVTGVDAKGRALIEAGRPVHLDFAAPGADMVSAVPGGGWERVRGTSFAAPLVSARLALAIQAGARSPIGTLSIEARKGSGRIGRGIVCADCAVPPGKVGLK